MDFEMQNVKESSSQEVLWDFMIKDGKLCTVDYTQADEQRAVIATFLQRGTIPQLPSTGNQWAELLTGQTTPQQLNAQVRNSIMDMTGGLKYLPKYTEVEGQLMVEVKGV